MNYFMFWVWCRCLLACDDLLRSISEIMVRMYQNTTQERDQIELRKNKEEKTPTQRPTEDEKVEKGVRAHNTIFASRASMCKLMHEIICYWSMRYMKSIRKFNLLIYTKHCFPFQFRMSGKHRNTHRERMRMRDACIIYSLLATSNWTFRKKLISFSIIKFGYWKKPKKKISVRGSAVKRNPWFFVCVHTQTHTHTHICVRMCVEVWFWHAQTHTQWNGREWFGWQGFTRVHTYTPTNTREFKRVTKVCKKHTTHRAILSEYNKLLLKRPKKKDDNMTANIARWFEGLKNGKQ